MLGFADDVTVNASGMAFVPMQSRGTVFAYDVIQAIRAIEMAANAAPTTAYESRSQYQNVPAKLTSLVRGPLGHIPIDMMYPQVIVAGHYGFYEDGRNTGYGVPPKDPYGSEPNLFGPISVGRLPRGVESQTITTIPELRAVPTPYTQTPSLQAFPGNSESVETGRTSVAEIHSGALHEQHALITYQSQGLSRGVTLHYDSLRAEPRLRTYLGLAGVPQAADDDDLLVARAMATLRSQSVVSESEYAPRPAEFAAGFRGDEHFFSLPNSLADDQIYGTSLTLDFRDRDTGVYDLQFDFGLFREGAAGFVDGRFQSEREWLAVVNGQDSPFGAGWGVSGLMRIYSGEGTLLLTDGNGTEQIFLAPTVAGEPFTPLTLDRSVLRQRQDGSFERKMIDGTIELYNEHGLLETIRDRNGNETTYRYDPDGNILEITDPVGLKTRFQYSNGLVQQIIDPEGRTTTLNYEGKKLISIQDPDGSKRSFQYDAIVPDDPSLDPYEFLMTGQVLKRGNDPGEALNSPFAETVEYNDFGQVVSGVRVDGKSFALKSAQAQAAHLPRVTSSPLAAPPLVALLDEIPEKEERIRRAQILCGLSEEDTEGSTFTATATYTDFDGTEQIYSMSGFGSFVNATKGKSGKDIGRSFGRDKNDGLITLQVDQIGNVVCFAYDDFGNILESSDFPDGPGTTRRATTTYHYEDQDFPSIWTRMSDPIGRTTTRQLDDWGNILVETISTVEDLPQGNPKTATTRYSYFTSGAADGLPETITDPVGNVTQFKYDNFGRLIETIYVDGKATQVYNDLTGNPHRKVDADGFELVYTYDAMNRFKSSSVFVSIDAQQYTEQAEYDAEGNLIREVDRNGNTTEFQFDVMDRPTRRVEAVGELNAVTQYAYEYGDLSVKGQVPFNKDFTYRYQTDPNGNTSLFVEDELGLPRYIVDTLGRVTTYQYNDAYQLTGMVMPDGGLIAMTLDGRGRITKQSGPTVEEMRLEYDDANRVIRRTLINPTTGDQITSTRYNLYGAIAETIDAEGYVTRIEHDAANNPIRIVQNASGSEQRVTEHELDGRNRIIKTTINEIAETTREYFPSGRLKSLTDAVQSRTEYLYDELGRTVSVVDAEGFQIHHIYDGVGNQIAIVDGRAQGNRESEDFRVQFQYDALHRLIASTDQEGNTTHFEYDLAGNQTKLIDPRSDNDWPIETSMEYDANHRLKSLTNAEGRTTRYTYDLNDNVILVESQRLTADGVVVTDVTTHFFNKSSRREWTVDAAGQRTEFQYDLVGNLIQLVDERGAQARTEFRHDKLNRVVERTLGAGSSIAATTRTIFHPLGMVEEIIDPTGQRTVTTFDSLQQPATITVAAGTSKPSVTRYVYDAVGNLKSVSDPRGSFYTRTFEYDKLHRQILESGPSGTPESPKNYAIETEYDAIGNVIRRSDLRDGLEVRMEYDQAGRMIVSYDQLQQATTYAYDAAGNRIRIESPALSDAGPAIMTMTYDKLGNQSSVVDALGNRTCMGYDDASNLIFTVDARAGVGSCDGVTPERFASKIYYDGLGRQIALVDAGGYRTEWEYDAADNVISSVDPRTFDGANPGEFVTTMIYDALGQLSQRSSPVGKQGADEIAVEHFVYNKVGLLEFYTNPRGYKTTTVYDPLHRPEVTTVETGEANLVTRTEYDEVGNLVRSTDARGDYHTVTYRYDAGNRIVEMVQPNGSLESPQGVAVTRFEYDKAGNLLKEIDPRGDYYTTTFVVDALGRIESQSVPTGSLSSPTPFAVTTHAYYPGGTVKSTTSPRRNSGESLLPTSFVYDQAGRLVETIDPLGSSTRYTLDAAGNVIEVVETASGSTESRTTKMTYDDLNRLVTVEDAAGYTTTNTYDAMGNVLRVEGPFPNSMMERTYDGRNLVRSETDSEGNRTSYDYDLSGNRIRRADPRGGWADTEYVYDGANRLIEVHESTSSANESMPKAITKRELDGIGNVLRLIDPRGEAFATVTRYNHRGQPVEIDYPAGPESSPVRESDLFEYDVAGNLVKKTDPRGDAYATIYEVDAAGRNLSVTYGLGPNSSGSQSLTESFVYDVEGNLLRHVGTGGALYVTTYAYDALGRVVSQIDPEGQRVQSVYDRFGNLLEREDVIGRSRMTYDELDRVLTKTNGENETLQITYAASGREFVSRDPLGNETVTKLDRLGRVVATVDAVGREERIRYDEVGNPIELVDRNGHVSRSTFDARNLQLSNTIGAGTQDAVTTHFEFDVLGRLIAEIDPRGEYYRTEHQYDARNRLIETRRRAGTPETQGIGTPGSAEWIVEEYLLDSVGYSIGMIPARGDDYSISMIVDGMGRIVESRRQVGTSEHPAEEVSHFVYNDAGQMIQATNSLGHTTERSYDRVGRLVRETIKRSGQADLSVTYEYIDTLKGYRVEQRDANNHLQVATDYDRANRVVRVESRSGELQTRKYDDAGNLVEATEGDIRRIYTYDKLNRLQTESDGSGSAIQYRYDAHGNLISKQDARLSNPVEYVYDALHRKRGIKDPDGGFTTLSYDKAGNLETVRDPSGNVTTYIYDAMHRLVRETTSQGNREFVYDPAGNVIRYTDRNGRITTRTYDGNQRLVREEWLDADSSAIRSLEFAYDQLGRMTEARDGHAVNRFTFAGDASGQIVGGTVQIAAGVPEFQFSLTHNVLGQATRLQIDEGLRPGVVVETYSYREQDDRLESIQQNGSAVSSKRVEFDYHEGAEVFSEIRRFSESGSLVATTRSQLNDQKLVSQIHHTHSAGSINQHDYLYDADYRVTSHTDRYGASTFVYDDTGRLVSTDHSNPNQSDEFYQYDESGNRVTSSQHGSEYQYVAHNQLASDGIFSYEFDLEGNLILQRSVETGDETRYEWDHRNRLIRATNATATGIITGIVEFGYDGLNRRVWKEVDRDGDGPQPAIWRGYLYNEQDVILEVVDTDGLGQGESPAIEVVYLHGASGDSPLAQDIDTAVTWMLTDRLGSVRDIVDGAGQLVDHLLYDSYGQILQRADDSISNRYFFAGLPWESELGWYYNRARFYDPSNGRFVSEDPSAFRGGDPNLYRYGLNDPINNVDPSGLSASALWNPLTSAVRELQQDRQLALESAVTIGNVNMVTFTSGVIEDFGKIAVPLAMFAASSAFPPLAPVIGVASFGMGAWGLAQAAAEPGSEGLELWDGVKMLGGAVAGMFGFRAAFAVGTLLNTADVGVGMYYNDRDRVLGALTGYATDAYGYRTSFSQEVVQYSQEGRSIPSGFLAGMKENIGDMQLTTLSGKSLSRSLRETDAWALKSDAQKVLQYAQQAREFRASQVKNGVVADAVSLRLAIEPPAIHGSFFKKVQLFHDAVESARLGWHGTLDREVHRAARSELRNRVTSAIKDDDPRSLHLKQQVEESLISELTDTTWMPDRKVASSRGTRQKAQEAANAFVSELRGVGFMDQVRLAGNRIVDFNTRHNVVYRETIKSMVNKQIRQSGRILDDTAKLSLHEQAINLHASAMHLTTNPDGPTLSAPYNHQSVLKKLPDMIRRWDPLESTCRHASLSIL